MPPAEASQPSLLAPAEPLHAPAAGLLRLVTWNVQHASPSRSRAQAAWIAEQETADVVVLTEVGGGPGGDALVQALRDAGYHGLVAPTGGADYRTVLASRLPSLEPVTSGIEVMAHRAPVARLTVGPTTVSFLGLYVPSRGPKDRKNQNKRAFQNDVTGQLPQLVKQLGDLVVAAGDLNVVEPDHEPHHKVFGAWEYDFYRSFADAGLTDAFRALHQDRRDHSWFGRSGNGYRFDHAFISTPHAGQLLTCAYAHEPRTGGLSDHSAMTMTVTLSDSG